MATRRGIKKLTVEDGHSNGVCDFCHNKGETFKLISKHRKYRFLNICPDCLTTLRSCFRKS